MVYRRDPVAAEQEISRALKLNPRFQEAHYLYSFFLSTRGRFDEGIAEAKLALELDPFSLRLNHHLGNSYYLARRFDEAIGQYQQAVELDTKNPSLHESLGDAYEQNGLYDQGSPNGRVRLLCQMMAMRLPFWVRPTPKMGSSTLSGCYLSRNSSG